MENEPQPLKGALTFTAMSTVCHPFSVNGELIPVRTEVECWAIRFDQRLIRTKRKQLDHIFVSDVIIHEDLGVSFIHEEIKRLLANYHIKLSKHENQLVSDLATTV